MMTEFRKVGAAWQRETKNGHPKLSIVLGEQKYIALKNQRKTLPSQPDWTIFSLPERPSLPLEQQE